LLTLLLVIIAAVAVYKWLLFAGGMRAGVPRPAGDSFLPLQLHIDAPRRNEK